jgi:hypothetical protein
MLAHLRTEAYPVYTEHRYPPERGAPLSYERNLQLIEDAKAVKQVSSFVAMERGEFR